MVRPNLRDVMAALLAVKPGELFYIAVYKNGWSAGRTLPKTTGVLALVSTEMGKDRRKTVRKAISQLERTVKNREKEKSNAASRVSSPDSLHS